MPWKVTAVREQRLWLFEQHRLDEQPFGELCAQLGISRKTGYKWLQRIHDHGALQGACDRSRAPHTRPHAVDPALARRIRALRERHPTWGPKKLRARLQLDSPAVAWPAASTIGELLRGWGLAVPRKPRRHATPNAAPIGTAAPQPNALWCADFKGWFLTGDGRRCTPLTISDAHTRFVLRCQGLEGATGFAQVQPLFEAAFRQWGLPAALRTDNGPPFASTGLAGLSRLAVWWLKLGIAPERIAPGKPQQNGRHERMHRTLKAETAAPPQANLRAQQRRFDAFVREFNHQRPHEALGQRTPASLYTASPRSYPTRLLDLADYPHGWITRKVKDSGRIKWDGAALHLSDALTGEYVGLEPDTQDGWWKIWFGPLWLASLDEHTLSIVPRRKPPKERRGR